MSAYKGAAPLISDKAILGTAAGILATEAYHGGAIRALLLEIGDQTVFPYATKVRGLLGRGARGCACRLRRAGAARAPPYSSAPGAASTQPASTSLT